MSQAQAILDRLPAPDVSALGQLKHSLARWTAMRQGVSNIPTDAAEWTRGAILGAIYLVRNEPAEAVAQAVDALVEAGIWATAKAAGVAKTAATAPFRILRWYFQSLWDMGWEIASLKAQLARQQWVWGLYVSAGSVTVKTAWNTAVKGDSLDKAFVKAAGAGWVFDLLERWREEQAGDDEFEWVEARALQ